MMKFCRNFATVYVARKNSISRKKGENAGMIRRALFGQATSSKVASTDHNRQNELAQKATGLKSTTVGQKPQKTCGYMRRLKAASCHSKETANVDNFFLKLIPLTLSCARLQEFLRKGTEKEVWDWERKLSVGAQRQTSRRPSEPRWISRTISTWFRFYLGSGRKTF